MASDICSAGTKVPSETQLEAVVAQEGSGASSSELPGEPAGFRAGSFKQGKEPPKGPEARKSRLCMGTDGVWGHVAGQMRLESGVGEDKAGEGGRSQQHIWKAEVLSREPPGWGP